MKSRILQVDDHGLVYQALMFVCPACGNDLHLLAINSPQKKPSWEFNGNLEAPTLSPSILSQYNRGGKNGPEVYYVCHSYLRDGVFEYLEDCTHEFAGKKVPMQDLPQWALHEGE